LLASGLLKRGHGVSVITLFGEGHDFYKLPAGVKRVALNIAGNSPTMLQGITNNLRRLRKLRAAVRSVSPDIVISHTAQTNVLSSLAVIGTRRKLVLVEHSDPSRNAGPGWWKLLRRISYPFANKLVSVSRGVNEFFNWLPESRKSVIHNPLADDCLPSRNVTDSDAKQVVAMGRLVAVKGFDRLLTAFRLASEQTPDWRLVIIGEGELRPELEETIERYGLADNVQLMGLVRNPFEVLRRSRFFVMSSRSEGFPYALLEAMACGLPAIAMDCSAGPREIIRDNVDGIIVPEGDVAALATAMRRLMTDEAERRRLSAQALQVREKFSADKIVQRWEELFAEILERDNTDRSSSR
jgi:glycosyltransferase involved in cell wall biosynthesis